MGQYKIEEFNRIVVRALEKPDFKQDLTCRRHLESSGPLNVTDLLKEVRKSDPVKNQRRD